MALGNRQAMAQNEVHVNNLAEFLAAMHSDRTIVLDCDIEFEDDLELISKQNPRLLPSINNYEEDKVAQYEGHCFMDWVNDGYQLYIKGVKNLTIKNASQMMSTIRVKPRYAYVLNFLECDGVTIESLCLGHTDEGYCTGGVLNFENCHDISIRNCDLYGCGIEGICCRGCANVEMSNSIIRNCSYDIMTLVDSRNLIFRNCYFIDNREYTLLNIRDCDGVTYEDCLLSNNVGQLFEIVGDCNVKMRKCFINHHSALDAYYMANYQGLLSFEDCIFGFNPGSKKEE